MAIITKQQIIDTVSALTGTDDVSLTLLGDITDTLDDYETRTGSFDTEREQYEARLAALDTEWREKFKARFSGAYTEEAKDPTVEPPKPITTDDLFK